MVAAEYKELSTQNPEWQREAVKLAQAGTPFIVVDFSRELDTPFFQAIKDRFNLETSLDLEYKRAYFKPKKAA